MIILPEEVPDSLILRAYSYQWQELAVLTTYLSRGQYDFLSVDLAPDNYKRHGILFRIFGNDHVFRFQNILGVRFEGNRTSFLPGGDGLPYKCKRINHNAASKGCESIIALDDHAAFIKCSLLASERNWFGAASEPGKCEPWDC